MATATQAQLDATVIKSGGGKVTVGDMVKGKTTVLVFFPAAFTDVCTTEVCTFRDSLARFNAVQAQVAGVSIDTPFTLNVFAKQNGLTFPLLSDANREAIRAFDVVWPDLGGVRETASRAVIVLDRAGEVIYRWVGDNPGQEPKYEEVIAAVEHAA